MAWLGLDATTAVDHLSGDDLGSHHGNVVLPPYAARWVTGP